MLEDSETGGNPHPQGEWVHIMRHAKEDHKRARSRVEARKWQRKNYKTWFQKGLTEKEIENLRRLRAE